MRQLALLLLSALFCVHHGLAGTIRVLPAGGGHLISAHSPVGETFTAEDPWVIAGLYIFEEYPSSDRSLSVQLFQGTGVGGPLLDSRILTPPQTFSGYVDVNYADNNIALMPGEVYTITLSAEQGSGWVSASSFDRVDAYPGGVAVISGQLRPELGDKAFEVVPTAVSEPSTSSVIVVAIIGVLLNMARRVRGGHRPSVTA